MYTMELYYKQGFHYDVNTTFGIHYSLNAMETQLSIHYGYYGKDNNYTTFFSKSTKTTWITLLDSLPLL